MRTFALGAALSLAACGARSHRVGGDGDADADGDADTDADADADADADDAVCGVCDYRVSDSYSELEGPETACAGPVGFHVSFSHGIGSHECSTYAESRWEIAQERVGVAVFQVTIESFVCYCEDDCCPGGCGIEDVFHPTVWIPTDRFGAGTYYVNVGEESIAVRVDWC